MNKSKDSASMYANQINKGESLDLSFMYGRRFGSTKVDVSAFGKFHKRGK